LADPKKVPKAESNNGKEVPREVRLSPELLAKGKEFSDVFRQVITLWIQDWCDQFCEHVTDEDRARIIRDMCHAQVLCLEEFSPATMINLFLRAKTQVDAQSVLDLLKGLDS
jgi:hypothetical protein